MDSVEFCVRESQVFFFTSIRSHGTAKILLGFYPLMILVILKSSPPILGGSRLRLQCEDPSVNALQGNDDCLFWQPYGTNTHWAKCIGDSARGSRCHTNHAFLYCNQIV
jgi:hypothetical protein